MFNKNTKQKGFTLVELLVVIAIIGLLSTLSIVALNSARTKARDAARVAGIKQWQTALELYYSDNGGYPNSTPAASSSPGNALVRKGNVYLTKIPTNTAPFTGSTNCNPSGEFGYGVTNGSATDGGTSYQLTYCLEGGAGGVSAGWHTATPAGIQ
jgi:prepilin-type N-terminal cleavage/methylation domain-containing protein